MFYKKFLLMVILIVSMAETLNADYSFGHMFEDMKNPIIYDIQRKKNTKNEKINVQKVALVIGNQNYSSHTQLKNPINDAKLIKKTLEDLGFDVLVAYDADIDALDKNIDTFMKKAKKSDVALIYYAGYGIGVEGRNYLIPIDTHNLSKSNLSRKLISLNELQNSVAKAKKFGVVLFDACRNSFFRQNIEGLGNARASRALVRPTVRHTRNILVSFSTQAGTIAKDDIAGGKHSPYALALSEKLKESKDIRLVMGGVKDRVLELTDNAQEPIDRSSLGGDAFYLASHRVQISENKRIMVSHTAEPKSTEVTLKWLNPNKKTCEDNGGKIIKKNICNATWKNAKKICSVSNARLPSKNELREIIEQCGGEIITYGTNNWIKVRDRNYENKRYQSCMKKKGFSNHLYWSSSTDSSKSKYAWLAFIESCNIRNYAKTNDFYVRCVK